MARFRTHFFALLGLVLAACGSGTVTTDELSSPNAKTSSTQAAATAESETSTSQATAATTTTPAAMFDLPSAELTEMATGETVNLTSVADGKPLVLWFWAPH